jgi:putative PIN family toxin of toxin-antitoxin system
MIIVLDTNVVVSAMLSPSSPPARIIHHLEAGEFSVAISKAMLAELRRALGYPKILKLVKFPNEILDAFISHYESSATLVEPQFELHVTKEDLADNRVLECALAGGASFIVTDDRHLLDLKEYQGVVILPPAGFITFLALEGKKG